MSSKPLAPNAKKRVTTRTRTAYHEAGHAVLASAIGDRPHVVSIRADGARLGVTKYKHDAARPTSAVQVHLGGYAMELP